MNKLLVEVIERFKQKPKQPEPSPDQWIDDMIWEAVGQPENKGKQINIWEDNLDV